MSLEEAVLDVKEAVARAKQHIADIYADEQISNFGLEEVEFCDPDKTWSVTVGFSRPWDSVRNSVVTVISGDVTPRRSYKVVKVSDASGEVLSVKAREKVLG